MSDDITEPPSPSVPDPASPRNAAPDPAPQLGDDIDLDAIEHDLDDVQAALARLADGTYWTDEVTGEAIPDHVLASAPLARRA